MGILIIILITIPLTTLIVFVFNFHNNPISCTPNDWYEFISLIIGIINLIITGVIAWIVNTINKKNSRRNSVLQFIGEIYIDLENVTDRTIKIIDESLIDYNFEEVNIQKIIDNLENKLVRLKPKFIAFYNDKTCESYTDLLAIVKDFNFQIRFVKGININVKEEDIFRNKEILDYYVQLKKSLNGTKRLMKEYLKE